jgi:hypothetical protein
LGTKKKKGLLVNRLPDRDELNSEEAVAELKRQEQEGDEDNQQIILLSVFLSCHSWN